MVKIKTRVRLSCILLIALMLFQSCRVYHRENVSLDQAVTEKKRVKLKTKDGQKLKFKRIIIDSSLYYGITKVKGKTLKTLIRPSNIESLRLHNKTMSIIYGVFIGAVAVVIGSLVLLLAAWSGPNIPVSFMFV